MLLYSIWLFVKFICQKDYIKLKFKIDQDPIWSLKMYYVVFFKLNLILLKIYWFIYYYEP